MQPNTLAITDGRRPEKADTPNIAIESAWRIYPSGTPPSFARTAARRLGKLGERAAIRSRISSSHKDRKGSSTNNAAQ